MDKGLRERKREETTARLKDAAIALFLKKGYDATTVDDIAHEADVSRRTFFHYFKSKEDVAYAWQDDFGISLVSAIAELPISATPLALAEEAMVHALGRYNSADAQALGKLIDKTPALRARDQMKYEGLETAVAAALMARFPKKTDALFVRLAAMVVIGALRVTGAAIRGEPQKQSPAEQARVVIAAMHAQFTSPSGTAKYRR